MAVVKTQANQSRAFIGKAWNQIVKKEGSPSNGKSFINISIDRGVAANLQAGDKLQLWPNNKRDGKRDADWRLSVITSEE